VIRAGHAGEYGYLVVCPRAQADTVWAELRAAGQRLEAGVVGLDALRHCAFENWVFDPHREGRSGLDALELQLTWRLDLLKAAPGLDAIRTHREGGLRRRIISIVAPRQPAAGTPVALDGDVVGEVIAAVPNLWGDDWRVLAAVQANEAHPGLNVVIANDMCRTLSAPWVLNRSLFVNPQKHSWISRNQIALPRELRWNHSTHW
jgi:glycine cleavage system aminomethyltransferase T